MKKKLNSVQMKVDPEDRDQLKKIGRELSLIEDTDISMGKVVGRMLKAEDIKDRLRLGSEERRKKLR